MFAMCVDHVQSICVYLGLLSTLFTDVEPKVIPLNTYNSLNIVVSGFNRCMRVFYSFCAY